MLITEDEAKRKWCPLGRSLYDKAGGAATAINRDGHGEPVARCVAGACMFWREQTKRIPPDPKLKIEQEPGGALYSEMKVGYCGAAGVPFVARAVR